MALRVFCTMLDQSLLKVENVFCIVIFYCLVIICQLNSHLLSERANPERTPMHKPLKMPESHFLDAAHDIYDQDESKDEISFDPDRLVSFQNHHLTVISGTFEETISLVSSEDDNVDTAHCVHVDTEKEHSLSSPPFPTADCLSNPPSPATLPQQRNQEECSCGSRIMSQMILSSLSQFLHSHLLHFSYHHHLRHPGCMDFHHKWQLRQHLSTTFHIYDKPTFHLFFSIIYMLRNLG